MEFRILGPLEVLADGCRVELGGPKQRALLAALLLEANRVVASDRLIEVLWEEEPPETAQKALHVHVSQLRKLVGKERLQTKAPGYLLRVESEELDLERFQRLHAEGGHAEALALWRGPALAEFAYQRFAQAEIARLEELRLSCLEERIEVDLAAGRHSDLVGELDALLAERPLRQRLRAQLMLALYRSGRDSEALEAYQDARFRLVEELGIEPRRELRELQQAILKQDPALDLVAASNPAVDSGRAAFVGRERELGELLAGLDAAFAGRGSLFLLVGEPGIGKSRLADELIGRAKARGARVLIGRCWEAGGAPAYWPWVQSLRAYIREIDPETVRQQLGAGAAELAQLLPELGDLLGGQSERPAVEPDAARFRLFEAASSFLTSAAQTRPLVLVLDDLHAADESSLLLLRFLARELGESRLLVVGACRDVDPTPTEPLRVALTELAREPVTKSLMLGGLGEREVARFIELTSGEAPSDELVATMHAETEGNPLFVGEIVRLLAAEGTLDTGALRVGIPQSIRDVIARRLGHLSEECNRVLVLASVLGREFRLDALGRAAAVSEDELLDILDEAMSARVVSEVPGSSGYQRFAHVLIRDTLYEGLTTGRRVRLHRLAVDALETLYGDEPGPHLAELAHHSVAGSDFDKARRYARRAGDRALALYAYEEAARLYGAALEALDLSGPSEEAARCELLLLLGEAEIRAGDSPAAKRAFLNAAEIAQRLGLARELARAAAGYGGRIMYARPGGDDRLVPLLERGLAAIADAEDVELRTRLLARLAGALRDEHSRDRRDALSMEAVELARRAGNPTALAYALDGRAAAISAPDTVAECLALGRELCEVGEQIGDRERIVHGHWHQLIAGAFIGDIRAAELTVVAASRIAEELRQPAQLWGLVAAKAMLAIAAGRFREADALVTEAFAFGERAQPEMAIPVYQLQRYTLCGFRGTLDEVEPAVIGLVTDYPARPFLRCLLVHLHAQLGRTDDARRELDELATDAFKALPFDQEWLFGISFLAETSSLLADTESAAVLYRLLLPWAAFNVANHPEGMRGAVARYLGLLTTTLGRWSEAAGHFEDALAMNKRMGVRPWLAHTQNDYARMLLARDGPGDRERSQELLDQAHATYRELEMDAYAARASVLIDEIDAPAQSAESAAATPTPPKHR
jgi:DNA-binding SARP family transcriptional activator